MSKLRDIIREEIRNVLEEGYESKVPKVVQEATGPGWIVKYVDHKGRDVAEDFKPASGNPEKAAKELANIILDKNETWALDVVTVELWDYDENLLATATV